MNTKEVVETFRELGWIPKLNVDRYAEREFGDRVAEVLFKFKSLGEYQKFEASYAIRCAEFTAAVKEVEGRRSEFNDMLKDNLKDTLSVMEPEITREHIETACANAIDWAMSVDIEERYNELCDLDPATPGAAGIWHLAALALKRHSDRLIHYQSRFEIGDNCGFVNFIGKDHIDRAVALANRP